MYARYQTNTLRLSGHLTAQMFNKKAQMAFGTLQVKAVEGLLSFIDTIGHRSTGALSTRRGRKREIEESKLNNLKHYKQPDLTKVTFYPPSNLEMHYKLL